MGGLTLVTSKVALDSIRIALGADVALLLARSTARGRLRVVARAGAADLIPDEIPAAAGSVLARALGGTASAALSGLQLHVGNAAEGPALGPSLVVPVADPDVGPAVLVVGRRRPGVEFGPGDLEQARRLAETAGMAAPLRAPEMLEELGGDQTFRHAFEAAAAGMSLVDSELRYRWVNVPLCVMLDRTPDEMLGLAAVETVHPDHVDRALAFYDRLRHGDFGAVRGRLMFNRPDGAPVWAELGGSVVAGTNGRPLFLVQQFDITAEQGIAEEYAHRAMHDDLTGLANRALLRDRLRSALAHSGRAGSRMVVFYLDIDQFKDVNDQYGHAAGDIVLRETAQRLVGVVRAGDTVARVGGDEFVVAGEAGDVAEATQLAERIGVALQPKVDIGGKLISVSVSIGVALDGPGDVSDDIVNRADRALLRAKRLPSLRVLSAESS